MGLMPKQQTIQFADVDLCVFEWGQPGGQQVLLAHATGFHARCWDQIVAKLPADWHIFALDMRGHGRDHAYRARICANQRATLRRFDPSNAHETLSHGRARPAGHRADPIRRRIGRRRQIELSVVLASGPYVITPSLPVNDKLFGVVLR